MKPHKHAKLIKAWADGAEIEYRFFISGTQWSDWLPFNDGSWSYSDSDYEYRIKPEPKPDVVRWKFAWKTQEGLWQETGYFYSDVEAKEHFNTELCKKLEYTRTVFDGETGELKSAEVLK